MVEPSIGLNPHVGAVLSPLLGKTLVRSVFEGTHSISTSPVEMTHLCILPPLDLAWSLLGLFGRRLLDTDALVEVPTVSVREP